jgi:hypothetical protein
MAKEENTNNEQSGLSTWQKLLLVGAFIVIAFWAFNQIAKFVEARDQRIIEAVLAAQPQPQVVNTETEVLFEQQVKYIGSNTSDNDTYFPELSCSHLASCTITEVPLGYFTIGYSDNGDGCDWVLFNEGDNIDYKVLDEFHTYNVRLPYTRLEGFVASQFMYVFACNN